MQPCICGEEQSNRPRMVDTSCTSSGVCLAVLPIAWDLVHQLDLHVNAANLSWKIPNHFTGIRRVLIDVDR
jgi:hypothetical protein